jgi:uncharacterized protein (DUF1778 family)
MGARSSQLQIRVTPAEKSALKRLAAAAGESVSTYVLSRVLPSEERVISALYHVLAEKGRDDRATLAELAGVLAGMLPTEVHERVPEPDRATLGPVLLNSIAALVETAAHRKEVDPPAWVAAVPPLPRPHFGWTLRSLRPHQLRVTPIPFKRRNLYFDPSTGPSP